MGHSQRDKDQFFYNRTDYIFADYKDMKETFGLWSPNSVIILNGLKSIGTGFKWTKIDGSPLKFTENFETTDVDYGYTAFSENQIQGNLKEIILKT